MRPYILKSIEFDNKRMVIKTFTNYGVYEYRILPALNGQKDSNIIRYERGRWVIRSKEYSILKNGNDILAKIRVYHEPTHHDIRVICPIYSTPIFLDYYYDNLRELMEKNEKLQKFNKMLNYRLGNVFEDLISVGILTELGFSKEDVVKALNLKQTWSVVFNIIQMLDYGIKDLTGTSLRTIVKNYLPALSKPKIPDSFKNVDLSSLANMNPAERLSIICLGYDVYDTTLNKFLKDYFNIEINKKLQIEWVKGNIESVKDPFMKLRWILEYQRLTKQRIDLNESVEIAFVYHKII